LLKYAFQVVDDNEQFLVILNVSQFAREELTICQKGRDLVVEGHHEEDSDAHGSIERHYIRKYRLPDDFAIGNITSHLDQQGRVHIRAMKFPLHHNIPFRVAPAEANMEEAQ